MLNFMILPAYIIRDSVDTVKTGVVIDNTCMSVSGLWGGIEVRITVGNHVISTSTMRNRSMRF